MTENNNLNIQKVHKGLIDNQGRRKYFRLLDPVLLDDPIKIDVKSIKKRHKVLFLIPNFHWIDEDVNALWDLVPWNLCQIAAMIEDISSEVKIIDAYKDNLSKNAANNALTKFLASKALNIFGGIVRCDRVAQGVIDALSQIEVIIPVVIRLEGTNAIEANHLLKNAEHNFIVANSLADAAEKVVRESNPPGPPVSHEAWIPRASSSPIVFTIACASAP